jgi:multicomponent Na+:H+ antiporter subunit E
MSWWRDDAPYVAGLTAVWVLLWGDLSVANVLTGAVAAALLLVVFPLGHDIERVRHRFRLGAAVRLVLAFGWELTAASVVMIRHILGGRARERPGVVACPLRVGAPGLLTFLTNMIAMSPGTMPIDVDEDPPVLYVHVLRLQDPEDVRARVSRFERLAVLALGSADAVAAVSVPPPPPPHLATERGG